MIQSHSIFCHFEFFKQYLFVHAISRNLPHFFISSFCSSHFFHKIEYQKLPCLENSIHSFINLSKNSWICWVLFCFSSQNHKTIASSITFELTFVLTMIYSFKNIRCCSNRWSFFCFWRNFSIPHWTFFFLRSLESIS